METKGTQRKEDWKRQNERIKLKRLLKELKMVKKNLQKLNKDLL